MKITLLLIGLAFGNAISNSQDAPVEEKKTSDSLPLDGPKNAAPNPGHKEPLGQIPPGTDPFHVTAPGKIPLPRSTHRVSPGPFFPKDFINIPPDTTHPAPEATKRIDRKPASDSAAPIPTKGNQPSHQNP